MPVPSQLFRPFLVAYCHPAHLSTLIFTSRTEIPTTNGTFSAARNQSIELAMFIRDISLSCRGQQVSWPSNVYAFSSSELLQCCYYGDARFWHQKLNLKIHQIGTRQCLTLRHQTLIAAQELPQSLHTPPSEVFPLHKVVVKVYSASAPIHFGTRQPLKITTIHGKET